MNSLLENQKIGKRRHFDSVTQAGNMKASKARVLPLMAFARQDTSSRESGRRRGIKPAFRPAGITSLFEQNSRLIEKIRQEPLKVQRRKYVYPKLVQKQNNPESEIDISTGKKRRFSVSLPLVPVTALFLLVTGVFFVVQNQGGMSWMDRQVVSFNNAPGGQYNLALYAGVNQAISQEINAEPAESGDIIPLDLAETFAWHNYRVRGGDTVSQIAKNFSVSMDAVIASNGITNARTLREGEIIRIPNMDGIPYIVKDGDSLTHISQSMGVPLEAILDANDIQSDIIKAGMNLFIPGARMNRQDLRMALGELFIHPVRGARLTSPFGWRNDPISGVRRHHAAVDLAAPQGTPILAAMEGSVSALGFNATYGNFVIISHPGNYQTLYAHLHTILAKRGEQVRQGARIGTVGNTGYSTGPHLHFAVYRNGRAVNPLDYLVSQR